MNISLTITSSPFHLFVFTADKKKRLMTISKDYYEVLHLDRSADEDAVKKAYRKMALKVMSV